jgi:hypothetical protein
MAPSVPATKKCEFDPRKFLAIIGDDRKVVALPTKQTIFPRGRTQLLRRGVAKAGDQYCR